MRVMDLDPFTKADEAGKVLLRKRNRCLLRLGEGEAWKRLDWLASGDEIEVLPANLRLALGIGKLDQIERAHYRVTGARQALAPEWVTPNGHLLQRNYVGSPAEGALQLPLAG